ncbi:DUF4398 domain-containing protein [Streptomyces ficellus]|uniref:DUF4398 domain-containing protein n=1 Tax=Streptomyces ficellus TaxID=1977088 RepID=A0A6I6FA22_9ACTN|nr:DUF4398 domain-containing protein [Streptomyces ficellus]QGV77052.1 DUF4398 domain-containing protein [Streptomyces ficellus]
MDERYAKARALSQSVRRTYWPAYQQDPNIIGMAFGQRTTGGSRTDEPAVVIYVARKVSDRYLPPSRHLPQRLYVGGDSIEVDVVETGPVYPLEFTARTRPAPSGISIGHPLVTAGTLGCLVRDNTDSSLCILSNNHVLANHNAAMPGDAIIQPGTFDGGTAPGDTIATLKRFTTIGMSGNTIDAAIAQVTNPGDVVDRMMNNLMPVPGPGHPAVGLLFAGSCNRTFINPIQDVMTQLNIAFPAGAGSTATAQIGMNVEKVGRTTEYTTSTVLEIDATLTLAYNFGPATFDSQIATAWLCEGGDSGSIVCQGGAGGNEDHCGGCLIISMASSMLGEDLSVHQQLEKEFREQHLSRTRTGKYLIDVFFHNEDRLVNRARQTRLSEEDRAHARRLYDRYAELITRIMARPHVDETRLSAEDLAEARQALQLAKRYMTAEEGAVADELFELAKRAQGLKPGEVLHMLDHPAVHDRVKQLVSRIDFLQQPEP